MLENCDAIVISRIFGQFGAVRRLDSGHRVCKSYVFSNSNLLSNKNWKQLKNLQHSSHTITLSKGTFLDKNTNFLKKKMLTSPKLRGPRH